MMRAVILTRVTRGKIALGVNISGKLCAAVLSYHQLCHLRAVVAKLRARAVAP